LGRRETSERVLIIRDLFPSRRLLSRGAVPSPFLSEFDVVSFEQEAIHDAKGALEREAKVKRAKTISTRNPIPIPWLLPRPAQCSTTLYSTMLDGTETSWTSLYPFPTDSNVGTVFLFSATALFTLYHAVVFSQGHYCPAALLRTEEEKLRALRFRSWIVTACSSFVMTFASLPFLWDLVVGGWDVALVGRRDQLAQALVSFFVAYLFVDCTLGLLCYRSQFNVLTGWVHHSGYTMLLSV